MNILRSAMLKWRKADQWPEAAASVYHCTWTWDASGEGPEGWTTLSYSYQARGEWFSGEVRWGDEKGADTYRMGDTITIRYDPKRPKRSYFPDRESIDHPLLFVAILGIAVAVFFIFSIAVIGNVSH